MSGVAVQRGGAICDAKTSRHAIQVFALIAEPWSSELEWRFREGRMTPRLYTFGISHFAEKARWALDYKGIDYEEARLVPGAYLPVVKRIAPRTMVPVLRDGEHVVQGSSAIIDYLDAHIPERPLTPLDASERERARELETWLDRELGSRCVAYFTSTRSTIEIWSFP